MLMTRAPTSLNLIDIECRIPDRGENLQCGKKYKPVTSLRTGRPTMLTWRVKKKEKVLTLLFFPNGTIQCVGNSSDMDTTELHHELCEVLECNLPLWEVKSMTVLCILNTSYDFNSLFSNQNVTYEVELFPAVQMSFWQNVHVHAFHNGKLVITGITSPSYIPRIVMDVYNFFNLKKK